MIRLMKFPVAIFSTIIVAQIAVNQVSGENGGLYKSIDDKGVAHYSSKPIKKGAVKVELPPIMRGEVKVPTGYLITCREHGGIDCQAGADSDDSVICGDGFKDSAQRFRFSCSSPKLEISSVSSPQEDGTFSIILRNSRGILAQQTVVTVTLPNGKSAALEGPKEVEPFGTAEFTYVPSTAKSDPLSNSQKIAFKGKPGMDKFSVICENCQ